LTGPPEDTAQPDGPPRALLIAAIAVAGAAVVALLVIAALRQAQAPRQPVAVASVPAPHADSGECAALLAALPGQLADYHRTTLAQPAPVGAAAWQAFDGDETVTLRCGLQRPTEFVVGTAIQVVDAVQWFQVSDPQPTPGGRSTWYAVDRAVYVAITLPLGSGPTPIQQISDVIAQTMPETPIDPAPAP
jgi:uncharacterized protein DUF3515